MKYLIIYLCISFVSFLIIGIMMLLSKPGYEDQKGFHPGKKEDKK
jgi:hypothetical protein